MSVEATEQGEGGAEAPDPMERVMALMAPGAPFEMGTEEVLGEEMQVFVQRLGSLRDLLASSTRYGDVDYAVFHDGDRRIALSFADNVRRVASVAAALSERGIGAGDRVAILAAKLVILGTKLVALDDWASILNECLDGFSTIFEGSIEPRGF